MMMKAYILTVEDSNGTVCKFTFPIEGYGETIIKHFIHEGYEVTVKEGFIEAPRLKEVEIAQCRGEALAYERYLIQVRKDSYTAACELLGLEEFKTKEYVGHMGSSSNYPEPEGEREPLNY
jgi:hypothetical protein